MTYDTLKIEHRGPAAWVWMNRPKLHNAFDETLIAELTAAFAALDPDPAVRVIVLAGAGKSFSAGADLNWMKRQGAAVFDDNLADARKLAALFRAIAESSSMMVESAGPSSSENSEGSMRASGRSLRNSINSASSLSRLALLSW
jgi:methylglutaconyl-CoA hydratase